MIPQNNSTDGLLDFRARFGFTLSLVFVVLMGTLIVVWVDIPRFSAVNEALASEQIELDDPITMAAAQVANVVVVILWFVGFFIVKII